MAFGFLACTLAVEFCYRETRACLYISLDPLRSKHEEKQVTHTNTQEQHNT